MSSISDALAAGGLLLAVVAIVFGAWIGDIERAASYVFKPQKDAREPERAELRAVLRGKGGLLLVGSAAAALVFVPRCAALVLESVNCSHTAGCMYDDVGSALLVAELFVVMIVGNTAWALWRIGRRLKASYK